jgi:hypothetical protein
MIRRSLLALVLVVLVVAARGDGVSLADREAYSKCVEAASGRDASADMIAVCEAPAKAGIPGAQYALGAALFARNQGGDRTAGVEWLEKSAASGSPAAQLVLAGILVQEDAPASKERGRELSKAAICAGYPPALDIAKQYGVSREKLGCAASPNTNFDGDWIADLKYTSAPMATTTQFSLKVTIAGGNARVFMKPGSDWSEVKPGSFKVRQLDETITVSVLESGWDFDGKWIETWTIHLQRLDASTAAMTYLRTVNNPHIPPALGWRTFTTFAEGTAHLTTAPPSPR